MAFNAPFSRVFRPPAGPGLAVATGVTTLILDQFTDTNGTLLTAYTIAPINTPGASWGFLANQFEIQSNRASNASNILTKSMIWRKKAILTSQR